MNIKIKKMLLPLLFLGVALHFTSCDNEKLVVEVEDVYKEYDGVETLPENIKILSGSLNKNHHLEFELIQNDKSVINPGEYEINANVYVVDKKGKDVSSKYDIEIVPGYVDISKRILKVSIPSQDYVYDGNEIKLGDLDIIDGSLVEGDYLELELESKIDIVGANNDILKNSKLLVYDSLNNDVTSYYELDFDIGKINILPKEITIKPVEINKTYDGKVTNPCEYEIVSGGLVDSHKIEVTYKNVDLVNACENVKTNIDTCTIYDAFGNDVTKNYSINTLESSITINKKETTLTTFSSSKSYDGNVLENKEYEIENLADDDMLDLSNATFASITNSGSILNEIKGYKIVNENGDNVTENYIINTNFGILAIDVSIIEITGKSCSWLYDGNEHSLNDDHYPLDVKGLNKDIDVTVKYNSSIKELGTCENTIESIYFDGIDVTNDSQYAFIINNGNLVVSDTIYITLKDIEKIYDGKSFKDDLAIDNDLYNAILSLTVLPEGLVVEYVKDAYPFINEYEISQGTYTIDVIIRNEDYEDVTSNYKIEISEASYSILKASYDMTYITWNDKNATYDGLEHEVTLSNLPEGVSVKEYSNNKYIDAGTYLANATFIYDSIHYNEPVIDNYSWVINKACNSITNFEVYNYSLDDYKIPTLDTLCGKEKVEYLYSKDNINFVSTIPQTTGAYYVKAYIEELDNYNSVYSESKTFYVLAKEKLSESNSNYNIIINTLNSSNISIDFSNLVFNYLKENNTIENLSISYNYNDDNPYMVGSLEVSGKAIYGFDNSTYDIDIIIYNDMVYSKVNETNNSYLVGIDYYSDKAKAYESYLKTGLYNKLSTILNVSLDSIYSYFNQIIPVFEYYSSLSLTDATSKLISRGFKESSSNYEIDYDKLLNTNETLYYVSSDGKTVGSYLSYIDSMFNKPTGRYASYGASRAVFEYIKSYFNYTLETVYSKCLEKEGINLYDYLAVADDIASRYSPYHDFIGVLGKIKDEHKTLKEIANEYPTYRICDLVGLAMGMETPVSAGVKSAMKIKISDMYNDLVYETAYESFSSTNQEAYNVYKQTKDLYTNLKKSSTVNLTTLNNIVNTISISLNDFELDTLTNVSGSINISLNNNVDNKYNIILNTIIDNI